MKTLRISAIILPVLLFLSGGTHAWADTPAQQGVSCLLDMNFLEWLKTIIAACIGGFISGFFLLLKSKQDHDRIERSVYKEIHAKKRIEVYSKLTKETNEFWSLYSPITQGAEPLRWPKDRRFSPDYFDEPLSPIVKERKEHAEKIEEKTGSLARIISDNALYIGEEVNKTWALHYWSLLAIKQHATNGNLQDDFAIMDAWEKSKAIIIDKLTIAIWKDLDDIGYKSTSPDDILKLMKEGIEQGKSLIEKAKGK